MARMGKGATVKGDDEIRDSAESPHRGARDLLVRAVLVDLETGATADVASLAVARQIAELLRQADGGELPNRVKSDAPLPHYESFRDPQDLERRIVARFHGAYPDRFIARTYDRDFADRIAELLSRIDPARKIRVRYGIGWW
jgi:hypothetical protein